MIDVVVVTLLRPTLLDCIKAIDDVIPNPNIILITEHGRIGDLRNKGLERVRTDIFAFVDDDVIVNKEWWSEAQKSIQKHDLVCAPYPPYYLGLGAALGKTEAIRKQGFEPQYDGFIFSRINYEVLHTQVEHRDYHHVRHTLFWLRQGFNFGVRNAFNQLIHSRNIYFTLGYAVALFYSLKRWLFKKFDSRCGLRKA